MFAFRLQHHQARLPTRAILGNVRLTRTHAGNRICESVCVEYLHLRDCCYVVASGQMILPFSCRINIANVFAVATALQNCQ